LDPKKDNKNPNNKKKITGFVSILLWALILTILFNYLYASFNSKGTVEVYYSDFRAAVKQGAVEQVIMDSSEFTFYLKDGWSMTSDGTLVYKTPDFRRGC
jgi:cell division protease FtsH